MANIIQCWQLARCSQLLFWYKGAPPPSLLHFILIGFIIVPQIHPKHYWGLLGELLYLILIQFLGLGSVPANTNCCQDCCQEAGCQQCSQQSLHPQPGLLPAWGDSTYLPNGLTQNFLNPPAGGIHVGSLFGMCRFPNPWDPRPGLNHLRNLHREPKPQWFPSSGKFEKLALQWPVRLWKQTAWVWLLARLLPCDFVQVA